MIERYVLLKLDEEHTTPAGRRAVAERSKSDLQAVPQVRGVRVGVSADTSPDSDWDVSLAVQLDSGDDIAPYSMDPIHRAYVDSYLKPKLTAIRAWNFELVG